MRRGRPEEAGRGIEAWGQDTLLNHSSGLDQSEERGKVKR